MAFRRKRSAFRRRKSRWETYTITSCTHCMNVYQDMPCSSPLVDSFPIMSMATQASPTDTTHVSNPSDRFVTVGGIKFQSEYTHDPAETINFPQCDPGSSILTFHLTIWEAIVKVPCAPGTNNIPLYVPQLVGGFNEQQGDMADRVLWKRITQLPIISSASLVVPELTSTERNTAAGPVAVKAKVRLDDRSMLLFVRNYTHNIFGLGNISNSCTDDPVTNPCVIPVRDLFWAKVFYHTIK